MVRDAAAQAASRYATACGSPWTHTAGCCAAEPRARPAAPAPGPRGAVAAGCPAAPQLDRSVASLVEDGLVEQEDGPGGVLYRLPV